MGRTESVRLVLWNSFTLNTYQGLDWSVYVGSGTGSDTCIYQVELEDDEVIIIIRGYHLYTLLVTSLVYTYTYIEYMHLISYLIPRYLRFYLIHSLDFTLYIMTSRHTRKHKKKKNLQ